MLPFVLLKGSKIEINMYLRTILESLEQFNDFLNWVYQLPEGYEVLFHQDFVNYIIGSEGSEIIKKVNEYFKMKNKTEYDSRWGFKILMTYKEPTKDNQNQEE